MKRPIPYTHAFLASPPLFFCLLAAFFFFGCDETSLAARIRQLESSYSVRRVEAAEHIAKMGKDAKAALPALRRRIMIDADIHARLACIQALEKIADPSALPELLERLSDDIEAIRAAAGQAIGAIGAPAIPALNAFFSKPLPLEAASQAAYALGLIGEPALPLLQRLLRSSSGKLRQHVAEALRKIGLPAAPLLLKALHDNDATIRAYVAWILVRLGKEILEKMPQEKENLLSSLQKTLYDTDDKARMYGTLALRSLDKAAAPAIPQLRKMLRNDPIWYIRKTAASTLLRLGNAAAEAAPDLLFALSDPTWDTRQEAADALLRLQNKALQPKLAPLTQDHRPHIRALALRLLARIAPPPPAEIMRLFFRALADPSKMVREAAQTQLLFLAQQAPLSLIPLLLKESSSLEQRLSILADLAEDPKARAALKPFSAQLLRLLSPLPSTRSLRSLGQIFQRLTPPQNDPTRLAKIHQGSEKERLTAARELGMKKKLESTEEQALCLALRDPNPPTRQAAALSLAWHAKGLTKQGHHCLHSLFEREREEITRLLVIDALGGLHKAEKNLQEALIKRLLHASPAEQMRLLHAIRAHSHTKHTLALLLQITEQASATLLSKMLPLLVEQAYALFPQKNPSAPLLQGVCRLLERLLQDLRLSLRLRAAEAYSELGIHGAPSLPILRKQLRDAPLPLQREILIALGWLGQAAEDAAKDILPFLQHRDPLAQRNAVFALRRIGDKAIPLLLAALPKAQGVLLDNLIFALGSGVFHPNLTSSVLQALQTRKSSLQRDPKRLRALQRTRLHIESSDKPYILWVDQPRSPTFDAFTPGILQPHTL